jgi:hypothetical protein
MLKTCPAVWLSLALASGPAKEPSPRPKAAEMGKPFELKAGELATVSPAGLTVRFDGVSDDSRCPIGVQCVWEGDAVVDVTLEKPPAEKATRALHTSGRHPRDTTYEGLKIGLRDLSPRPKEGAPVEAQDYRATFVVSEAR